MTIEKTIHEDGRETVTVAMGWSRETVSITDWSKALATAKTNDFHTPKKSGAK